MSVHIPGPTRALVMAMVLPVMVAAACSETAPQLGTVAPEESGGQAASSNSTPVPTASPTTGHEVSDPPIPEPNWSPSPANGFILQSAPPLAQVHLTVRQVAAWWRKHFRQNSIRAPMPGRTALDFDEVGGRIVISINCEENPVKAREGLRERMREVGIPTEVVVLELMDRIRFPRERLLFECIPPEVVDPVTGVSKPGFGGMYVESGIATIYMLEPSQDEGERLVLKQLGSERFANLREARVVKGLHTWSELTEWWKLIRRSLRHTGASISVDFDPRMNHLQLGIRSIEDDEVLATVRRVLTRRSVPNTAVYLQDYENRVKYLE